MPNEEKHEVMTIPVDTVTIPIGYYDQLVVAFEHLNIIEDLAFSEPSLGWKNDIRLDMGKAEDYIKAICGWRVRKIHEELTAKKSEEVEE